jgi:uncharacterized damage-inducible protein DinB
MTTTASATSLTDALAAQLNVSQMAIKRNLEGVTPDESTVKPQGGGNSANWIVGHIVVARHRLLTVLGEKGLLSEENIATYTRGSSGSVTSGLALESLVDAFHRSQPLLVARLQRLTDAELTTKSPMNSPAGPDASLGAALAAMVFHEAYHIGQLGIVRRLLGKSGAI